MSSENSPLIPIYHPRQIRELEQLAQDRFNISSQTMMECAGKAALAVLLRRFPQAKKLAVFCGGGNNGGDGYVLARYAHNQGLAVDIWQVGHRDSTTAEAQRALDACRESTVPIHAFDEKTDLNHPDVIVDAICGIGLRDSLREETAVAIQKMQTMTAPIFSLDIPSGLSAETGQVLGIAVNAEVTITFIGLKLGLLTGEGRTYTGELICNDLQLPPALLRAVDPIAEKIVLTSYYATDLKPRLRHWHKGLSGHVVVVGGAPGFCGAPRLAAEAALRVGAGLVSVATHPDHAAAMNATRPEIMCHGVREAQDLAPLLARADTVILGPGLGQSAWAKALWAAVCEHHLPLVVDADGLNVLSATPTFKENWILTPHPGEAGRLLNETTQAVQADRLTAGQTIQQRYGGVCVLKGAGSLVFAPHTLPAVCDKGNPGMASAGMGDVLSGVIGGLMAQGIPLAEAAKIGVELHAMAGDLAARDGERGTVAMDLMPHLRRLCNP